MVLFIEPLEPRCAPAGLLPDLAILVEHVEIHSAWEAERDARDAELLAATEDTHALSPLDQIGDAFDFASDDLFRYDPEILAALAEWPLAS